MLQSFSFELVLGQLWRRQWHSTPVLLPGKSHGQRVLVGCSPRGCYELDMTEWLHFHFSLLCIGEGNGNPLQCSCLENLRDGGAWWAAIYGVAQSLTRLMWLSSGSSNRPTKHENLPLEGTRQDWAVFLGYQKGRRENSGSHWDNILTLSWVILKEGHHSVHSSSERKLRLFLRTRDRKLNFQCCCIFMFFFFFYSLPFIAYLNVNLDICSFLNCWILNSIHYGYVIKDSYVIFFWPDFSQTQKTCKIWAYPFRIWITTLP